MNCLECKDLQRHFEHTRDRYVAARASAYYQVCTELAAKREVDMERAKSALEEHRDVCPMALAERTCQPLIVAAG